MKTRLLLVLALVSPFAMAADSGGGSSAGGQSDGTSQYGSSAEMRHARRFIEREKYKAAIQSLRLVVLEDSQNADAWNLLGFSSRKLGKVKNARKYYDRALSLDPDHKGALEYQGELFITLNDLDSARDNQRKLTALCPDGCEQLTDLSAAITAAGG